MGREKGSGVVEVLLSPLLHDGLHDAAWQKEGPSQHGMKSEEEDAQCCGPTPSLPPPGKATKRMLPVIRTQIPLLLEEILMVPIFLLKIKTKQNILKPPMQ